VPRAKPVAPPAPSVTPAAPATSAPVEPAVVAVPAPPIDPPASPPTVVSSPWQQRLAQRRRRWKNQLVGFVILVGLGVLAFPWLQNRLLPKLRQVFEEGPKGPRGNVQLSKEFNYRFIFPERDWLDDAPSRAGLKANFAIKRTEPTAWMAVAYKDFKTRNPTATEVADEAFTRLDSFFKGLEQESKPDVIVAGQPARRLVFQGEVNDAMMRGDCVMFAYQGIAYWFIAWAPRAVWNDAQDEVDGLRSRFALLKDRDSWSEKRPPLRLFRGKKATYQLHDSEGVWEAQPDPTVADPAADLLLQGRDRNEPKDVDKMGMTLVMIFEPQADAAVAVKGARAHLEEQQKKDYPATTFEEINNGDDPAQKAAGIGDAPAQVLRLRVKNGESRVRFVLLAVVPRPAQLFVIQCECDWRRRSTWERDFLQLLNTFTDKPSQEAAEP
jgi:hypothetical protein